MRKLPFIIALISLAFGVTADAASLEVLVAHDAGWDRVDVVLDPGGDDLNAVSGTLTFDPGLFELKSIEDRSAVPLWVERPALARTGEVDFAGISPGGFGTERLTIFSLLFQETGSGLARMGFRDAQALKDDGEGTPAPLTLIPADHLADGHRPSDPAPPSEDATPPEPFVPMLGRDASLFDGAWFLSFAAQDKGTGVAGYDVAESRAFIEPSRIADGLWKAAESPHRLQDQSRGGWVYVRAVDRAGNVRIETFAPDAHLPYQGAWVWGILAILGSCAVLALRLIRRARRA